MDRPELTLLGLFVIIAVGLILVFAFYQYPETTEPTIQPQLKPEHGTILPGWSEE